MELWSWERPERNSVQWVVILIKEEIGEDLRGQKKVSRVS